MHSIHDGPISRCVYNDFFNTYTKFCAFITNCTIVTNFLLCRPTIQGIYAHNLDRNDKTFKVRSMIFCEVVVTSTFICISGIDNLDMWPS